MNYIIDISWPISLQMTSYKNNKPITLTQTRSIESNGMRETHISLDAHTGTHVDSPNHKLIDGKTIDQIPLERLIGKAVVIDLSHVESEITNQDLENYNFDTENIVLLKTKNSTLSAEALFNTEFIYLGASGAHYLAQKKVKAVGIDYLGIERNSPNHATHTTLLSQNIPIIEGLRLGQVSAGIYDFYCLPLSIIGIDAAPARAILIASK